MKLRNYSLIILFLFIINYLGCYSFYSGIYLTKSSEINIESYNDNDEPQQIPDPVLDPPPIRPHPLPVTPPDKPIKYRPVQPLRIVSDQDNSREQRKASGNISSRDNSGDRNENPRRR
jgi:hypothetical protein